VWHLPQFSKRLELLIKPSNFGYNAYNQVIVVRIPNQVIPYLIEKNYYISFVDVDGNILCYSCKTFFPEVDKIEYYVKIIFIDDINYTSLFIYYDGVEIENNIKLFEDDFESGSLDTNGWVKSGNGVAGVGSHTAKSGIYSMYTRSGAVCVTSKAINVVVPIVVFYWIRRGSDSFSEDPDSNENLIVEYLNNESDWVQLDIFYGNGTPGQIYDKIHTLFEDSLHNEFRIRFRQTRGNASSDYWHIDDVIIHTGIGFLEYVFDDAYIVNFLDTTSLISKIGPNFSNHSAALHQPICDTYAVKILGGTTYVSCSISKSSFTLFFNCYLLFGEGYLVYFSSDNYVYVYSDGSLVAKINGNEYSVSSKLYFNECSTFSITCDGSNTYIVINGLTKLVIKRTFSISEIRLGGSGSSGYSIECYFFDLFLLPPKPPLYSYYLHNTIYDNSNFFRESGYDNNMINGYLTNWPEVIFSGDEVIFESNSCSGVVYSVSFNNGGHWHVSGLKYDSIFTKYFGSPSELYTVLKLTHSSGIINKNYVIKVNDFNKFSINNEIDFVVGNKKDGYLDVISDFKTALHDKDSVSLTTTEYGYYDIADLKSMYLEKPVEFLWGDLSGSGIISKQVEFCFDVIVDSWFDDIYIDFWLGELYQGYYVDVATKFVVESKNDMYTNVDVDFVLSNWKYFPHEVNVICSTASRCDVKTETKTDRGSLVRFFSDVKVSDEVYNDFYSSIVCSVSGVFPYYFSDIQVISGALSSYVCNTCCSLLDVDDYGFEVKLNTVIIENFNINVDNFSFGTPDFCFNVDVYDKHYGVTESGINIYMNTNIITGNYVDVLQFSTISRGYSVSWCYDISLLEPLEYVEIIVYVVNTRGDINVSSYFLKYGKRYYYNIYHIVKHEYEKLIPMLMIAENNVDIFPSFSSESIYVRIEKYKRKNLGASIFGIGLDRSDLLASINPITTNFYNGGSYTVRIECKDLSGNVMDPFEFEFIIRNDGL